MSPSSGHQSLDMTLSAGSKLGSHKILALIGAGSVGEVYKARAIEPGGRVRIRPTRLFSVMAGRKGTERSVTGDG